MYSLLVISAAKLRKNRERGIYTFSVFIITFTDVLLDSQMGGTEIYLVRVSLKPVPVVLLVAFLFTVLVCVPP